MSEPPAIKEIKLPVLQLSAALRPTGGGLRHKISDTKPVAVESDSQEKRRNRVAGAAENRYFCKYNEHQYAALMTKAEIVKHIAGQTGLESKMVAGVVEVLLERIRAAQIGGQNVYFRGSVMFGDTDRRQAFAPAGQSTQMIVGASGESDYTLIHTAQRLYQRYDLKRVFYSAYIPINEDSALPALDTAVPLLREHRLYQADWLLRYYGFHAEEILSENEPNLDQRMDPKCNWAVRHLDQFPVEVQTAPYDLLLRIPGIGPKSAGRIVRARRYGSLDFNNLKKMGVVLKRAHYFITCGGRMMYRIPIERDYIVREMTDLSRGENWQASHGNEQYRQMTLFDIGMKA